MHPFRVSGVFPSTYHQGSAQKYHRIHKNEKNIEIFMFYVVPQDAWSQNVMMLGRLVVVKKRGTIGTVYSSSSKLHFLNNVMSM